MSLGEKIEKSNGFRVLLAIGLAILLVVTFGIIIRNSRQITNNQIYGNFTGEIIYSQNSLTNCTLDLNFDGAGEITGEIELGNSTFEIEDSEYTFLGGAIQFSFYYNETSIYLSFNGIVSNDFTVIQGDIRYYESSNILFEGTFLLTK